MSVFESFGSALGFRASEDVSNHEYCPVLDAKNFEPVRNVAAGPPDEHHALDKLKGVVKGIMAINRMKNTLGDRSGNAIPTWEPHTSFCYPVANIAGKLHIPVDLTWASFQNPVHIADGSNANIFRADYNGQTVIIKMIMEHQVSNPIAAHEFDIKHGVLARLDHPNVIKILGAGVSPRRFLVLEFLGGGTLSTAFMNNKSKQPTFTFPAMLYRAREMACGLDYLHEHCHEGATIIHRDLKPDNIGFMPDGTLKLFDLGLCTIVKHRENETVAYAMTGNTGSIRYMSPEGSPWPLLLL